MEDQLNRGIDIPKKRTPCVKYFFQFLLPAFLISSRANAQVKVKVTTKDEIKVKEGRTAGKPMLPTSQQQVRTAKVLQINIPSVLAGTYFLRLTSKKIVRSVTEKLIVKITLPLSLRKFRKNAHITLNFQGLVLYLRRVADCLFLHCLKT